MNVNIQAPTTEPAFPIVLFKAGQFVRLKNTEVVARVLEDTQDETSSTKVCIFDDDSWGSSPTFGPGCLRMWTPDSTGQSVKLVDVEYVQGVLIKLCDALEFAEDHAKVALEDGSGDFADDVLQLVCSTHADMAIELVHELQRAT